MTRRTRKSRPGLPGTGGKLDDRWRAHRRRVGMCKPRHGTPSSLTLACRTISAKMTTEASVGWQRQDNSEAATMSKKQKKKPAPASARFAVGALVRVRAGTVVPDFADIPLGGWAGTISEVDTRS